ncbi:MAG: hypothetical protein ACYC3I_01860 [Gemmataceae bacterium]
MPLHDWRDDRGWESVHLLWLAQLLDWVQPRLPAGYRAYLSSVPALTIDTPNGRPDVSVRQWEPAATDVPGERCGQLSCVSTLKTRPASSWPTICIWREGCTSLPGSAWTARSLFVPPE